MQLTFNEFVDPSPFFVRLTSSIRVFAAVILNGTQSIAYSASQGRTTLGAIIETPTTVHTGPFI